MFNRKAADPRNKPDRILETLKLGESQNVVDIGAGGGYFSLRFATIVGNKGKVYAADTNPEFLEFIRNTAATKGLSNVVTILATEGGPNLPENSIDIVFMRNVYHHLQDRVKYLGRLTSLLRRGGKIAVVEYRRSSAFSFRGLFRHYVPVEVITREMAEAGYKLDQSYDFLPDQSFMMFSLNRQDTDSQSASSN